MRRANRLNARSAVLIGDDELARNVVTVRDLDSGEQTDVPVTDAAFSELVAKLRALG
jgi:histidyl-tRNA synthetase